MRRFLLLFAFGLAVVGLVKGFDPATGTPHVFHGVATVFTVA